MDKPIVLIMCGGKSLRLWPLTEYKSKNFFDIFGFSPLEDTIKRFLKITSTENIFLIANIKEKDAFSQLKIIKKENIIFEPESKNTSAAILFSLFNLKKIFGDDKVLIITPVDHLIKKENNFYKSIISAIKIAKSGYICTIGINPIYPTPNFGYIQIDKKLDDGSFSIKRFIEKPTRLTAQDLIKRQDSFYNSGIFISLLSTLDKEYRQYYPFYEDFNKLFTSETISNEHLKALYKKIEDLSFDETIMEKTKKAKLIKGEFYWKDFGSWHAIYQILDKDKYGNVKKGKVFIYNGENNLIYLKNPKKKILVLGLKDIFFIDADDYILLSNRSNLDTLKLALKEFKIK
ncbi:MAG: sugar phosphate nucleotidyltransferase [Candidatus Omnitrophica bacterium]|nr:sugar phosphate nucleotidyltransferase [Candidatus Omnitrophota bacterium]